jgi:2-octaprenyl-6-methoxyphenol hydroxylase
MTSGASHDVVVVGAGAVGLAAALACAHAGLSVGLAGPAPTRRDGRSAALLEGSMNLLHALGVGDAVEQAGAPLRRMRIVDDTDSLFRPPPATFAAAEIGREAFGWNIENATLVAILADAVRNTGAIAWRPSMVEGLEPGLPIGVRQDGAILSALLVVAADGRDSAIRRAAGIAATTTDYRQAAFTTVLSHTAEHDSTSTEFHTRSGPFTLVPLPGRRSSLVWVTQPRHAERLRAMADGDLAQAIGRRARPLLGEVEVDGPRGVVPLRMMSVERLHADGVALVGEAAHVLPPIGAQGLNLGLSDIAALARLVRNARSTGEDVGSASLLQAFDRERRGDIRARSLAVDGLNRALLSSFGPIDALRGAGLGLLARVAPLRRAVMRAGLT